MTHGLCIPPMLAEFILTESKHVDSLLHSVCDVDVDTSIKHCMGTYVLRKTIQPRVAHDDTYNTYLNAYNAIMKAHLETQNPLIHMLCAPQRAEGRTPRKYGQVFEWRILIK